MDFGFINNYYVYFIIFIISLYVFRHQNKRFFAAFMYYLQKYYISKRLHPYKLKHFESLKEIISNDPELKKRNSIKILEVGVGTGPNFEYYPDGTHYVAVDPNPHFRSYYNENRSKFTNIKSEEFILTYGEEMDEVPSNSIDAVVITLVLCSVKKCEPLFKQIHRVLVPGGRYYFFDLIKDINESHYIIRFFQEFLTKIGLWGFLFDGCNLNRSGYKMIEKMKETGFKLVEEEIYYLPFIHPFTLFACTLRGIAVK